MSKATGKKKTTSAVPQVASSGLHASSEKKVKNGEEKLKRRHTAAKALAAELKGVRLIFKELVEKFVLRADSQLVGLIRELEKEHHLDDRQALPAAKRSLRWTEKIRALEVQPKKGKLKDIVLLNKLLNKLEAALGESK